MERKPNFQTGGIVGGPRPQHIKESKEQIIPADSLAKALQTFSADAEHAVRSFSYVSSRLHKEQLKKEKRLKYWFGAIAFILGLAMGLLIA